MVTRRHLLTAALAGGLAPLPARAEAPEPQALHLRRFDIMDAHGFEQPVPAASLLAPADWTLQGGVTWGANGISLCLTDIVTSRALLSSPDGRFGFEILPPRAWLWSRDQWQVQSMRQLAASRQSCPVAPPTGAAQALQQLILPAFRPNARVMVTEADPAAAEALRQEFQPLASARPQSQVQAEAVRLRLAWQGNEEWLTGGVAVISYSAMSPSLAMQGSMGYTQNYETYLQNMFGFRAPAGQLDAAQPVFGTILGSIRRNPAWDAAAGQILANIGRVAQQGAMDRAAIWRNAQAQIGEMQRQSWQYRQESQDRVARAFSQVIRGVETFVDPGGNRVELTAGYGHAWSNGLGEYIVSSDPNFVPGRRLNGNWTELQRGRP
jgi:hypothetical protein